MLGRPKDAYDYQNWKFFNENDIISPDFADRLVYFQADISKEDYSINTVNVYQGYTGALDNREFNYFTLDESEAKDYGTTVRKVTLSTEGFLKAFSNRALYRQEEKLFTQETGKIFDMLDNSPSGLDTQTQFFRFLKGKGYGGLDMTGWSDSQYIVSFYPVSEEPQEVRSKDVSKYVQGPDLTTDDFRCK